MQQSLRLISLSNYVFVLEISQISGIVQNVSMLIMVVMRIVAVVGEERRKRRERRSVTGTESSLRSKSLYQTRVFCSTQEFARKMLLLSVKHCPPPPPHFFPSSGAPICGRPQKGPL